MRDEIRRFMETLPGSLTAAKHRKEHYERSTQRPTRKPSAKKCAKATARSRWPAVHAIQPDGGCCSGGELLRFECGGRQRNWRTISGIQRRRTGRAARRARTWGCRAAIPTRWRRCKPGEVVLDLGSGRRLRRVHCRPKGRGHGARHRRGHDSRDAGEGAQEHCRLSRAHRAG